MTKPRIPAELQASGRRIWRALMDLAEVEEWEKTSLLEACRTADRLDLLQKELENAPLTTTNAKGDMIANPLLVEARQQSVVYTRLIASLRIPDSDGVQTQRRGGARRPYASHLSAVK